MKIKTSFERRIKLLILLLVFSLITCIKCPTSFTYEFVEQLNIAEGSNAIALDSDIGYVYAANLWYPQVYQYNLQGDSIKIFTDFTQENNGKYGYYSPIDLIVDDDNYVYILTKPRKQDIDSSWTFTDGFSVLKYNSTGEYQNELYFAEMNLEWYSGVMAYNMGIIYITNGKRLIKINTKDGQISEFVFEMQDSNHIEPNYIHIADMAIDEDDNIWVVGHTSLNWDTSYDWKVGVHITRFDSNCKNQKTFNSKCESSFFGSAPNNPGITFDSNNNMYIATGYCQSIEIYNVDQELLREIKLEDERSMPVDIAIDTNNNLYVLDSFNDKILIYKLDQ